MPGCDVVGKIILYGMRDSFKLPMFIHATVIGHSPKFVACPRSKSFLRVEIKTILVPV